MISPRGARREKKRQSGVGQEDEVLLRTVGRDIKETRGRYKTLLVSNACEILERTWDLWSPHEAQKVVRKEGVSSS